MPLITAGLGLITGIALVGLATHVTGMSNVAPELALMIGLGVGIDYALFIVTRFRENYARNGDVRARSIAGDGHLRPGDPAGRDDRDHRAAGHVRHRRDFMYGLAIASVLAVLMVLLASLTVLPALLCAFGHRVVRAEPVGRAGARPAARRRAPRPGGAGA